MTRSRKTLGSVAATLGALAIVCATAFSPSPAGAQEPTQPPPAAASLSAATDSAARVGPVHFDLASLTAPKRVTRPGAKSLHRIGFWNSTPAPARVYFRVGGFCGTKDKTITWYHKPKAVKVPPAKGGSTAQVIRYAWLKVPASCTRSDAARDAVGRDGNYYYQLSLKGGSKFDPYAAGAGGLLFGYAPSKYRKNFTLVSKPPGPAKRYDAHHTMPKKFKNFFSKRNLDINDTIHMRWWCKTKGYKGSHGAKAREYNRRWEEWIEKHPKAKREQIWRYRNELDKEYSKYYVCPADR